MDVLGNPTCESFGILKRLFQFSWLRLCQLLQAQFGGFARELFVGHLNTILIFRPRSGLRSHPIATRGRDQPVGTSVSCPAPAFPVSDTSAHIETAVRMNEFVRHEARRIGREENDDICNLVWLCHGTERHQI